MIQESAKLWAQRPMYGVHMGSSSMSRQSIGPLPNRVRTNAVKTCHKPSTVATQRLQGIPNLPLACSVFTTIDSSPLLSRGRHKMTACTVAQEPDGGKKIHRGIVLSPKTSFYKGLHIRYHTLGYVARITPKNRGYTASAPVLDLTTFLEVKNFFQ